MTLGAILTILSLAFETFSQQVILFETRPTSYRDARNYVPRMERIDTNSSSFSSGGKFEDKLQSFVLQCLDLLTFIAYAALKPCTDLNCSTWREWYREIYGGQ